MLRDIFFFNCANKIVRELISLQKCTEYRGLRLFLGNFQCSAITEVQGLYKICFSYGLVLYKF